MPADEDERMETPPADASGEAEAGRGSVEQSGDSAVEDSVGVDAEEQEPEPTEPPQDLTELPGTVVEDADVRVRPGLAWGVIDRLESGASVVVLHRAGGWYRVSYGEELEGWIRATMLDLGEVEEEQVLERSAPPLLAEWRGAEYGAMGQSADGAEVRLLEVSGESTRIIGAPIDEVTLLADDVTLRDLPILIGDETVVFPGDDFGVGQGKILPKANEWMWLPWGWLLAHNDTHIWQWRPETDELEFISRPPGFARLSPDGRYLAIDRLCDRPAMECDYEPYAIILPLDGSAPIAALTLLRLHGLTVELVRPGNGLLFLDWAPNSKAVSFFANVWDGQEAPATSVVVHVDGQLVLFDETGSLVFGDHECQISLGYPSSPGGFNYSWWMRADNTIVADGGCTEENGEWDGGVIVFSLDGDFLGVDDFPGWWERDYGIDRIRTAGSGQELGDDLRTTWSPTEQYALVVDPAVARVWIYDAGLHDLNVVQFEADDWQQSQLWAVREHDDELRHFYLHATWNRGMVGAVIAQLYGVRASIFVDATTTAGTTLDLGGASSYPLLLGSQSWDPDGHVYHVVSMPFEPGDGIAVGAPSVYQLLSFRRTGDLVAALNILSTCGDSVLSNRLRHRAAWSPDGKWFAVGGRQLDGMFFCSE